MLSWRERKTGESRQVQSNGASRLGSSEKSKERWVVTLWDQVDGQVGVVK